MEWQVLTARMRVAMQQLGVLRGAELAQEPRFAHSRLAANEDEAAGGQPLAGGAQLRQGGFAADERGFGRERGRQYVRASRSVCRRQQRSTRFRKGIDPQFPLQDQRTLLILTERGRAAARGDVQGDEPAVHGFVQFIGFQIFAGTGDGTGDFPTRAEQLRYAGQRCQIETFQATSGLLLPRLVFRRPGQGKPGQERAAVEAHSCLERGQIAGRAGHFETAAVNLNQFGSEGNGFFTDLEQLFLGQGGAQSG